MTTKRKANGASLAIGVYVTVGTIFLGGALGLSYAAYLNYKMQDYGTAFISAIVAILALIAALRIIIRTLKKKR